MLFYSNFKKTNDIYIYIDSSARIEITFDIPFLLKDISQLQ